MSVNTKVNGQLVKSAGLYSVSTPIGMADIYSTEEKEIGLWKNNKPLYQKTIVIGNGDVNVNQGSAPNYYYVASSGMSNIEDAFAVVDKSYMILSSDGTPRNFSWIDYQGDNTFVMYSMTQRTNVTVILTFQYTKTTDTPWSGIVPQGYGYVSSGDIYSFEERKIGVWCNGKPLYQKTIDFGAIPNSTTKTVNHGIENIENIWYVDAVTNYTGIVFGGIMPIVYSGKTFRVACRESAVEIVTNENWDNYTALVTVRYTKTTDVAGSGEYVPSGDKAVHYSTEEEVIGTWLGETLYRKVIDLGNLPNNSSKAVAHGISNFKTPIQASGYMTNGTDSTLIPFCTVGNMNYQIGLEFNSTNVVVYTGMDRSAFTGVIFLEYTKRSS